MLPSQFRKLDEEDKAELTALHEVLADMRAWEAHLDAEKAEKANRKKK